LKKLYREADWTPAGAHRVSANVWDRLVALGFVENRHLEGVRYVRLTAKGERVAAN
jgi:hypothetical protein